MTLGILGLFNGLLIFRLQAETASLNQQLNEKLLESTDGFHEDQRQLQVRV